MQVAISIYKIVRFLSSGINPTFIVSRHLRVWNLSDLNVIIVKILTRYLLIINLNVIHLRNTIYTYVYLVNVLLVC